MPRVYIAGKVTGEPPKECREKFIKAEFLLKKRGFSVVNPTRLVSPTSDWQNAMRICIKNLAECDAIYMLPDWKQSKGAKLEHAIAKATGLKVIYNYVEQGDVA